MFDGLFIISLISGIYQTIKESLEPEIPLENWANRELYYKDMVEGVSAEQRMRNLKNGKYRLTEELSDSQKEICEE